MQACKIMNYIVFDLEWNQSPTGKDGEHKELPFEIIEIGAIKLDENMNIISEFCETIRPQVYPQLHHIISELTHFDSEDLRLSRTFIEVFRDFRAWCGDDFMLCTWGSMDVTELQRNMKFYNFDLFQAPVYYYDIQKIFSIVYEDKKTKRSLEWAIDYLKIDKNINFHRALSDTYYTYSVMKLFKQNDITKNFSIDYFQKPQNRSEEIYVVYETYSKFVSREFENKTYVLKDKRMNSTICYKCGKKVRKKIRWFSDNSKTYYSLACCDEHGWLKGKIKLKKSDGEKVFAVKVLSLTDDQGADSIRQRQNAIRKKRREKRAKAE